LSLVEKVPYDKLSLGIIIFLILLTFFFTGFLGLFVLFVSTAIGLLAPLVGVKRSLCMGVLILPVALFYSGLNLNSFGFF
jgi:putative membrane protein